MHDAQQYREALDWIYGLPRFGGEPGLWRFGELINRPGCPHRRGRFLHVAGTNRKGSVTSMLGRWSGPRG